MSKKPSKDSPFGALQGLRERLVEQEKGKAELVRKERIEQLKKAAAVNAVEDENEMLARAMAGVKPLPGAAKPKKLSHPAAMAADAAGPAARPAGRPNSPSDDEAVLANLRSLVSEARPPLEFTEAEESVEGRASDCSRLELSRLAAGDYSIQATLDLHGKTRDEALAALTQFFAESIASGNRCVNVICGRGLHTPGGIPVLKDLLLGWLVRGRLSASVFAFSSARRQDGGVGAIYVLLRKNLKRV